MANLLETQEGAAQMDYSFRKNWIFLAIEPALLSELPTKTH